MKKKILLALLIVVILLGAGVAYAYFATDAFKSDKEIFLSYILTDNMFSNLKDEKLTEYIKKQENTAYTNKGEMSATVNEDNDLEETEEIIEMLNKGKITFEGKTDNSKKMAEQKITVDFSQGYNIPINYKRDGDTFGIQSNFLDSKYIAVRNENLKALLERFDIDAEKIPDKIEISQEQFTQAELTALQEKYVAILNDNLEDDLFSKEKVNSQTVVLLKLSEEKCIDVLIKILETIRDDEILLSKISEIYQEDFQQQIDEIIEELDYIETSEENAVEIRIYIEAKNVKKIEISMIEEDTTAMLIVIESDTNKVAMEIYEESALIGELSISKEESGNDVSYAIIMKVNSEEERKAEISLKLQYKNVLALDNVEENCEIKVSYEEDSDYIESSEENTEIDVNYKNLKTFSSNVETEGLNSDNSIIVNDATDEEIQNLIMSIYQNLGLMQ